MPLKTQKNHSSRKHPKHFAKVYWPYLPLILVLLAGLFIGHSSVARSQNGVLAYATNVHSTSLLSATNTQRTKNGQQGLQSNAALARAAQAKANDMAKRNYWSHNTPDGKAPWVFIEQTGYTYQKAGENLAYGFTTSDDTVVGWMNSPTHKENLLDAQYTEVGFGIANAPNYQQNGPETIVVAMYGKPLAVTAQAPIPPAPVADTSIKDTPQAVTSAAPIHEEPEVKSISRAQALTGGRVPWVSFGIGLFSGAALVYLLLKHGLGIRRAIRNGEKFVLSHPILDLTVISLVALCALLSQSIGFIR